MSGAINRGVALGMNAAGKVLALIGLQSVSPAERPPLETPAKSLSRPRGGVNAAARDRRLRMQRQSRRINRGGRHGGFR